MATKAKQKKLPAADVLAYLEMADVAMADAVFFDEVASRLDLADTEMLRLRDQLEVYLNSGAGDWCSECGQDRKGGFGPSGGCPHCNC